MRIWRLGILAVLTWSLTSFGLSALWGQGNKEFTGEIMDSQCAAMGSHQAMMKAEGAKDAKDCTLKCVQSGGKFVLFDSSNKTAYQLDDQTKAKEFAGQKVKVTGSADAASKTIHVQNIEAAS